MFIDNNKNKQAKINWLTLLVILIFAQASTFTLLKFVANDAHSVMDVIRHHLFYIALALVALRAIGWPLIIHHLELSFANSLSSLVPILILLASWYLFNENIYTKHIIGACLIILGNLLICSGKRT